MTPLAEGPLLKYLIIGSLPTVEKATVVPPPGIFNGSLTDLFATLISHPGTDTKVVFIQGNVILFRLPTLAPAPRLLHTEENIGYLHVGLL